MEISVVFPVDRGRTDAHDMSGTHPFSTFNSSTSRRREVWAIVAAGHRGEIGRRGDMPWHLPEDLRHFKEITTGHPVIMGRATWLSLPRRPLPGRRNIVVSRDSGFVPDGAERAASPAEAVGACPPPEIPVIIGGGKIYAETLPMVTRLYLTRIEADIPDADTFFPTLDPAHWKLTSSSPLMTSASGIAYRFETYESSNNQ